MGVLKNHPDMFLNDAAAASLERLEEDHGVQPITSAGRTLQEGKDLIARWNKGGKYNRPPYLYEPARPAENSSHYRNGGEAVDVTNWEWWRRNAGPYGWVVDFDWDVVHFRYDKSKDTYLNRVKETLKEVEKIMPQLLALIIYPAPNNPRNGVVAVLINGDIRALTEPEYKHLKWLKDNAGKPFLDGVREFTPGGDDAYDLLLNFYTNGPRYNG